MAEQATKAPTIKEDIQTAVGIVQRIKNDMKSVEWFTIAQLHSICKLTHDEVNYMMGILQAYGMLDQSAIEENKPPRYKVVTTLEERDRIINSVVERMKNDMQKLEYGIKRMDLILEVNPWKDPISAR